MIAILEKGTLAHKLYNKAQTSERHRHRLEVKNSYLGIMKENGMIVSGINKELNLVEIMELTDHPFLIGCQFHPEFKSRPDIPHPLFVGFIKAADQYRNTPT